MHIAVVARQIGNYHDARYRATAKLVERLTIISTANEGGFAEFLSDNVGPYAALRLFPNRRQYQLAVADGRLAAEVKATLDRIAPDAVAVSGWATPECAAAIAWARSNGAPLVMMSDSQRDDAPRSFVGEAVKSRLVSLCDAALVAGPPHASYVQRLGMPPDRIHLGYDVVDNRHFAEGAASARLVAQRARAEHGLPRRYILASARFIRKKNLSTLVAGYAQARRSTSSEKPDLVMLGDGEEKESILAVARAEGVERWLHLPGYRGYGALPTYYGLADAFVLVSIREQWGLVVNEAMASGLPVVVSEPCGAARTLLNDGVNGFVVDPDARSIGTTLNRLFSMDTEELAKMGRRAASTISEWGPERFANSLIAAFGSAAALPRRTRLTPWDAAILSRMQKSLFERVS